MTGPASFRRLTARPQRAGRTTGRLLRRWTGRWRRSLQLRVVTTTLLLSVSVVALLGALLINQVAAGLLSAKQKAAVAEANAGLNDAQLQVESADLSDARELPQFIDQLVTSLAAKGGPAGLYEVVLLATPDPRRTDVPPEERASGQVLGSTIPAQLRRQVVAEQRQEYTYVQVQYADGSRPTPGLVVGAPLSLGPVAGGYELYYVFPLRHEQETLVVLRRTLALAGLVLVALLAAIAWVVTRQVVNPVRLAAQIAERFSAGRLEERMRVRGEDDLARLATSFNSMATSLQRQIRQLEDLSRVQHRFVSDVSHELRTPLATVRMAADVLHESRAAFDPAVARSAELLQTQLDRFEALLADLLEISRFDAGAARLDAEPTDLRDLARRVVEAAEPLAERRGSALRLALPAEPCVAEVDPRRVERILRNLVGNAVEHGEGRDVAVRVAADDVAVAVVVRDHGVGLRPGESTLVFNRFWRADPARARTTGGTGLGLAIALEDAHLHGGWLQAWGEPGAGSQFRLTLPRRLGQPLDGSPLPLEPGDGYRRARGRPRPAAVPRG